MKKILFAGVLLMAFSCEKSFTCDCDSVTDSSSSTTLTGNEIAAETGNEKQECSAEEYSESQQGNNPTCD